MRLGLYRCPRGGGGAGDALELAQEEGATLFVALPRDLAFLELMVQLRELLL